MEHNNRVAQDAIRGLGANKTVLAVDRVGKAIGTIAPLLKKFDEENDVRAVSGAHKRANTSRDINIVVNELIKSKVFSTINGRKHPTFPSPKDLLHVKSNSELHEWMMYRLNKIM